MNHFFKQLFKVAIFSSVGMLSILFTLSIGIFVIAMIITGISADGAPEGSKVENREFVYGDKSSDNELLVLNVKGVILGDRDTQADWLTGIDTGVTYGYEVKEELAAAAEDDNIKGVLLYVNSPGGTIFGSEAIADGVAEYKAKTGKPVITFVSGMAASGGYWASTTSDQIVADTGTTIGSIGVIFGPFQYYDKVISQDGGAFIGGVVTQNGIENTYITAGRSKDIGNPYRRLTDEEVTTLQKMVNQSYGDFVARISSARGIEPSEIVTNIGALVYSEHQAKELKLIDEIMNKEEAYAALADKAGVKDEYKITRVQEEPSFISAVLSASLKTGQPAASNLASCHLSTLILAYHGDVQSICQQ